MRSLTVTTRLEVLCLVALFTVGCSAHKKDGTFIVFQGLKHHALGNAKLRIKGDQLVVSNMGSTGEDGVLIELGSTVRRWDTEWVRLDDRSEGAPKDGAFLVLTSRGTVNGVKDQVIGTAKAVDVGDHIEIYADYTSIGGKSYTSIVFDGGRNGKAVARADRQTEFAGQRIRWPFTGHVSGNNGIAIDFDWRGFKDRIVLGDGSSGEGDYLCTIPEDYAARVSEMAAVTIQTKGISSLLLTSEATTRVGD